ncbi:MAG: type IV toxin-antitoxin system AbiEi family antitoxin domain-containing protein [Tomitella sp.]|nr:type IV toxin-antitoxin system AbiEi family antitoxin domain-containing protein [Tomitella sp.]
MAHPHRMPIEIVLARQAGVITAAQAVAAGISLRTVQRRARSGEWTVLHPGVYLVGGHRLTDEVRVRAAWLWAGEQALVTGPAAAYWHTMLDRAPEHIELTVPKRLHLRPQPGVVLRRRDLSPVEWVVTRHVAVATEALAALETAVALPDGSVFLDRALQRHVRFPTLYRAYCRNLGRHGYSTAGRLIAAAADRADSAAERLLVRLLREAGIGGWVLGHPFGPYRIDLAFPAARVAVEVDGWAWHVDAERFRADRRKGNAITRGGWDLLRFTWHDLDGAPARTVAEIADTLTLAA